ncbi:REP element-mobilizing transposase RayT [Dysgonomonas hofstadii]|uniref:REP element-mobilizing transposase RayT n=1 Tax=Dysgonomonas hofstadii TaxID=637886 RepID=A0A840CQM9_9BACT|nr:transposase [Dysgonomonas hofstadii]MBB4035914.1 REP element-mobilizing transposase RayT [Dysgonomonas hofstadii]
MSRRYKFHNPDGLYFVSFAVKEWIDVFTRNEYKNIIVNSLSFCQKHKGLELFAWCIMTNHVHLIVRAMEGHLLQNILRDFKGFTSREILKAIRNNPQESRKEWLLEKFKDIDGNCFWATGNHPIELWNNEVIHQKLDYLHNNPVEESFVFRAEDYVYSSAVDYSGEKGLINVIVIE